MVGINSTFETSFHWCYYKIIFLTIFLKSHSSHPEAAHLNHHQVKRESYYTPYSYSGSLQGPKPACSSETLKKV